MSTYTLYVVPALGFSTYVGEQERRRTCARFIMIIIDKKNLFLFFVQGYALYGDDAHGRNDGRFSSEEDEEEDDVEKGRLLC